METAQAFEELASKGYFSAQVGSNVWPTGQNTELATGLAAMYCVGTYVVNETKNITGPDFQWGFFGYPEQENGINGLEAMVIEMCIRDSCKAMTTEIPSPIHLRFAKKHTCGIIFGVNSLFTCACGMPQRREHLYYKAVFLPKQKCITHGKCVFPEHVLACPKQCPIEPNAGERIHTLQAQCTSMTV